MVTKSDITTNWLLFAVASFLNKNYEKTIDIIDSFEKTLDNHKKFLKKYERSEMNLFLARTYEAMGRHQKAI